MTAGRDSRGLSTAIRKRLLLIKCPFHFLPFYLLAFAIKFCQTSKELTLQPELHHRVVILQPPPSLDCGLDGQSLFLDVWFFNCPAKATMLFLCNRDSSCASFLQTYKTPFSFSSRNHTTGCYLHQFLPLQKFLNEISICCLLFFQYISNYNLQLCPYVAAYFSIYAFFCYF